MDLSGLCVVAGGDSKERVVSTLAEPSSVSTLTTRQHMICAPELNSGKAPHMLSSATPAKRKRGKSCHAELVKMDISKSQEDGT